MHVVARYDGRDEIVELLLQRLNQRVRNRAAKIVERELKNAGIEAGKEFLAGLFPGGKATHLALDFLAEEVRAKVNSDRIAKQVENVRQRELKVLLRKARMDLRNIAQVRDNGIQRVKQKAARVFVNELRGRVKRGIAGAIEPIVGKDLANAGAGAIAREVRANVLNNLKAEGFSPEAAARRAKVEAKWASRRIKQLLKDSDKQAKLFRDASKIATRKAKETLIGGARRRVGGFVADQLASQLRLDRDVAKIFGEELADVIRPKHIKEIKRIIDNDIAQAQDLILKDIDVIREQLLEVVGTREIAKFPGESPKQYRERLKRIHGNLREINKAEVARAKAIEALGKQPLKELPAWREQWSPPVTPQRPIAPPPRKAEPGVLVLEPGKEPIVPEAPPTPRALLTEGTLKPVEEMNRKELEAELEYLKRQGQPVPRRFLGEDKLRDAVRRHRYGAYPGSFQKWPKSALPDPRSLTFSQLNDQLSELYENGFEDYFKDKRGRTMKAWWTKENKMRFILARIRRDQFKRSPQLRPPKRRRLKGMPPEPPVRVIPGSGKVLRLPLAPLKLPAVAGPPGPVRPIPEIEGLTYNQMQKVVKEMREAGYEVPKSRTKDSLSKYLNNARKQGLFLPAAEPPPATVRTRVGVGDLPLEQRAARLQGETEKAYISRLRGLIAHRTGEVPERAEIEGTKKYMNRLQKQYETLAANLKTPMEGWKPIEAPEYKPLPKSEKWQRIAGEKIDPYTERLGKLFRDRRGFYMQRLPEETKTQYMDRLKKAVRDLQETPPRGRETFSMGSTPINGSKRRYQYDPIRRLYLDTVTGKYRERFIFDAGMGQFRDLSSGRLVSARKIRDILRQSEMNAQEVLGNLNRALVEADPEDVTFKQTKREQRRITPFTPREKAINLGKTAIGKQLPETVFKAEVPNPFKNITLAQWEREAVGELKDLYSQQFALGAGGVDGLKNAVETQAKAIAKAKDITLEAARSEAKIKLMKPLNLMADEQIGRFEKMVDLLIDGGLTVAELLARSFLYAKAGKIAYNLGKRLREELSGKKEERRVLGPVEHCPDCVVYNSLGWQPIGTLPMPGEKSRCGGNCYCTMEYRTTATDSADPLNRLKTMGMRSLLPGLTA